MKFKMMVSNESEKWEEEMDVDVDVDNVEEYCKQLIKSFNNNLKPFETKRSFLGMKIIDYDNAKFHKWVKRTMGHSINYDSMFCRRCGITGKRNVLSHQVKIDSKYRKKVYQRCDTSLESKKKGLEK